MGQNVGSSDKNMIFKYLKGLVQKHLLKLCLFMKCIKFYIQAISTSKFLDFWQWSLSRSYCARDVGKCPQFVSANVSKGNLFLNCFTLNSIGLFHFVSSSSILHFLGVEHAVIHCKLRGVMYSIHSVNGFEMINLKIVYNFQFNTLIEKCFQENTFYFLP